MENDMRSTQHTRRRWISLALILALGTLAGGCVTPADFRKVERKVDDLQRKSTSNNSPTRVADLSAEIDELRAELDALAGRLEVSEHRAEEALAEAKAARAASAGPPIDANGVPVEQAGGPPPVGAEGAAPAAGELEEYRAAYDAWRDGDPEVCIDRFRNFLQTNPASAYADDASYWMADCYFKQGDFKTAVLRYDDVVSRYPKGNKAPDALYRQGEALLRLGPGYGKAAGKAFERVLKDYPDSARAGEAKRQLDLLGSS
jgi:tol-pal system protein YbgF